MINYRVVFYYKNEPSYKGSFNVQADNEPLAQRLVQIMVESKSYLIPGNWDYWRIYDDNENIQERD